MLAVNHSTGDCQVSTNEKNTAETVASFMVLIALKALENQNTELLVILDNASQHKKKMKTMLQQLLKEKGLEAKINVRFLHTPPYSPQMNAAEYNIQLIRKNFLNIFLTR